MSSRVQGKILVFVHGYTEAISYWTKVLELLPEEYHAYTLDLRGYGQSGQPGSYPLSRFVEDIYTFTKELGMEKFTYVGHSMGGKIGYRFALDHPDVLKGLFLVAPTLAHNYMSADEHAGFAASVKATFESPDVSPDLLAQQLTTPLSEELLNEIF